MTARHDAIVQICQRTHATHWRMSGDESTGDKLAARVTRDWQEAVAAEVGDGIQAEQPIGPDLGERIDLVDLTEGVAYELKVSPNNDAFEFYKDIFKVLLANEHLDDVIERFVFLCPDQAARRYAKGLRRAVVERAAAIVGFEIEVVGGRTRVTSRWRGKPAGGAHWSGWLREESPLTDSPHLRVGGSRLRWIGPISGAESDL